MVSNVVELGVGHGVGRRHVPRVRPVVHGGQEKHHARGASIRRLVDDPQPYGVVRLRDVRERHSERL